MKERERFKSLVTGWPVYGWLGVGLVAVFWILSWSPSGLRTQWTFFPLWLGYCLTVDALVLVRKGDSMLTRNSRAYVGLFLVSIAAWWLFEFLNQRTQNWIYEGRYTVTKFQHIVLGSISFSTVMPAVFGTAELASTFDWIARVGAGLEIVQTRRRLRGLFVTGWLMLALLFLWPVYFFPFLWLSIYLILDPVNVWLGNRSLLQYAAEGDWRPMLALWAGGLICGFFWEMWNFYSYPKWVYHIPFIDFLHIFEMPLFGYGGYLTFSMELFAVYHAVMGLGDRKGDQEFIQICPDR
jgi:hypothetical protein